MTSDIERADPDIGSWANRIRPIALVVFKRDDGAILVAPGYDRVKDKAFYRPLGGEIEFGELAIDAARREIHEDAERCPYCEQYISAEDAPRPPVPWWKLLGVLVCLVVVYLRVTGR